VTANAAIGPNYTIVGTPATATGTITPATVTVAAVSDTKFYDSTTASAGTPTYQVTSSNAGLNDALGANTLYTNSGTGPDSFTTLSQSFNSANVLDATTLTANAVIGPNYSIVGTPATASGTINPALVSVSAVTDTKYYDSTTASAGTPTYQVTSYNSSLGQTELAANTLYSSDAFTTLNQSFDSANAGPRTLSATAVIGPNYSVNSLSTAPGTITPATLDVAADNQIRGLADPLPPLTYTYQVATFNSSLGESELAANTLYSSDAFTGGLSTVGPFVLPSNYAINQGSLTAGGNYNIVYTPGTLTVDNSLSDSFLEQEIASKGTGKKSTNGTLLAIQNANTQGNVSLPNLSPAAGGDNLNALADLSPGAGGNSGVTPLIQCNDLTPCAINQ
jgi:hypothetical protein